MRRRRYGLEQPPPSCFEEGCDAAGVEDYQRIANMTHMGRLCCHMEIAERPWRRKWNGIINDATDQELRCRAELEWKLHTMHVRRVNPVPMAVSMPDSNSSHRARDQQALAENGIVVGCLCAMKCRPQSACSGTSVCKSPLDIWCQRRWNQLDSLAVLRQVHTNALAVFLEEGVADRLK